MWRAIRKYGWDNIEHVVIANGINRESAIYIEKDLIELYQSNDKEHGYNLSAGGEEGSYHNEESRKKMSIQRRGKPKSEEHRRKISEANKGHKLSDETKEKIRKKATGRHYDTDKNPRNIAVLQYDIVTKQLVGTYLSISKASRDTGLLRNHISECAKEKRRQEGGCIWVYKSMATEDYVQRRLENARLHNRYRPVVVYSDNNLDSPMYFESTVKAANYLGISESAIRTYIGNERNGYYVQRISVDEYFNNF